MDKITKNLIINGDFFDWQDMYHVYGWDINLYGSASYVASYYNSLLVIQFHVPTNAHYNLSYNYVYVESGIYGFAFGAFSTVANDPIKVLIKSEDDNMSYRLDTDEWVPGEYNNIIYLDSSYKNFHYNIHVDKTRKLSINFIHDSASSEIYNTYDYVRFTLPYLTIHNNKFLFYLDPIFFNKENENSLYLLNDPTYKILKNMNYPVYINISDLDFIEGYNDGWIINYNKLDILKNIPVPIFLNISFPLDDVINWEVPRESDFDGIDGYPHALALADLINIILNKRNDINILLFEHISDDIDPSKYIDFINYVNTIVSNIRTSYKETSIGLIDISNKDFFENLLINANEDVKNNYIDVEYKREFIFTNFTDVLKDKNGYPYHVLYRKYKYDEANFNITDTIINGRNINATMCSRHAARFFDYISNLRYPVSYMIDLYETATYEKFLASANEVGNDYWLFYLWNNYVNDGVILKYTHDMGLLDFQYIKNGINRLVLNRTFLSYSIDNDGFILHYDGPNMIQTSHLDSLTPASYAIIFDLPSALKYSEKDTLIYGTPIFSIKNKYKPNSDHIRINNRFYGYKTRIFAFTNSFNVSGMVFYDYYATDQYETSMFSTQYYFLKAKSKYSTFNNEDIKINTLNGKAVSTIIKFNDENKIVVYHNNFDEPLIISYPAITDSGVITDHTELLSSESAVKVNLVGNEIITYESGIHYLMLREKYPVVYLEKDLGVDERWIPYIEPYKFVYNDIVYDSSTYYNHSLERITTYAKHIKNNIYKLPHRNIINNGKYKIETEYGKILSVDYMNGYIMMDGNYGKKLKVSYTIRKNIYLCGTELNYTIPYFPSSLALNNGRPIFITIENDGVYYTVDNNYNALEVFKPDFSYNIKTLFSPHSLEIAMISAYTPWDADIEIDDMRERGGGIETDEFFKYYAKHVLNLDTEKIAILDVIREYFPDVDNYVDISVYDRFYDITNNTIVVNITKSDSQNIRNLLRPIKVYDGDFYTKIGVKEDIKGLFMGNINTVYDQLTDEYIEDLHDNKKIRYIGVDIHMGDVNNELLTKLDNLVNICSYNDVYVLLKSADSGIVSESILTHGWDMISYHFKDNPYLIYDICGFPSNDNWNDIAINIVETIRSNSKESLILIPGLYGYNLQSISGIQYYNVAYSLHIENLVDYSSIISSYIGNYPFIVSYITHSSPIQLLDTLTNNNIGWFVLSGIADDYLYNVVKHDPITEYLLEYFKNIALKTKAYGIPLVLNYHNLKEIIP